MYKELSERLSTVVKLIDEANGYLENVHSLIWQLSEMELGGKEIDDDYMDVLIQNIRPSHARFSLATQYLQEVCLQIVCEEAERENKS